jgi:hypothetical protein
MVNCFYFIQCTQDFRILIYLRVNIYYGIELKRKNNFQIFEHDKNFFRKTIWYSHKIQFIFNTLFFNKFGEFLT